jgi:uncharacterized protein YdcH (DUF465 family)
VCFRIIRNYERQLRDFVGKSFLAVDEELDVVRLKKMKLKAKDQMFKLMTKYAKQR